ncbi:tail fiber assembly protein [Siccibacter turicensis]|uniref:tail fiber assembly protein n=1 Tax=Siccibacter turicensis TaxID=357233 RepID=UPI002A6A50DE|nr:tail fiber assembly protein [Siccibacter turicensis]MDY0971390.1 tail fiber assembly protein [Siccibacter turicensis]
MKMLFSASTCAFYAADWEKDYRSSKSWPEDVKAVDEKTYIKFSQQPPFNKVLGEKNGLPTWVDMPPLTTAEADKANVSKREMLLSMAGSKINIWQAKLIMGRLSDDEKAKLSAWLDYIDALEAMDTSETGSINWPDLPVA